MQQRQAVFPEAILYTERVPEALGVKSHSPNDGHDATSCSKQADDLISHKATPSPPSGRLIEESMGEQ
jgi:hypothetical protein